MCRGVNDRYKLGGLTRPAVSWRSPTPLQNHVASDLQVQIERLYQAVRARLSDRVALLEAADPEIRAHVERMLSVDDSATFFDASAVAAPVADAIVPGRQLGPYRIEATIGLGGMGQVFRATDTRLDRVVAIKTSHLSYDPRFRREVRAIAALNHPNVCTLHDVGPNYLVMEFCDGETLAARIKRGKVSVEETVRVGAQIAAALAAAHARGITHRDLKPGNVILTKMGAKVLDFGLAKTSADDTVTMSHVVVGTPAYMAPEQREGRETDARTDIYALGLILHEMVTGARFQSKDTLASSVSPQLAHVIGRCLETDADERWQSAADVRRELEWAGKVRQTSPLVEAKSSHWPLLAAAVVIAGAGLAITWLLGQRVETSANPLAGARFTRLTDFDGSETDAAISRDGRFVAFRSDRAGLIDTWVTQVGTGRLVNLTNGSQSTVLVDNVGFTPDGSEVWLSGIIGGSRLRLVPLSGGTARAFLAEHAMNVAWSPDGARIVFQNYDPGDPIFVSDPTGANAQQIYIAGPGGHNHFPVWSADGQWIYFVSGMWDAREMDVWRIPSSGGSPERLTQVNTDMNYIAPLDARTILYTAPDENGAGPWLWALDTERKTTRRVSDGLERYTSVEASGNGRRLVATLSNRTANLWTVPLSEHVAHEADVKPLGLPSGRAFAPRYGTTALFYLSSRGGGDGLWRFENGEATEVWRGVDGALQEPPAVSPDGRRVAVLLRKAGKRTLTTLSSDGGDVRTVTRALDVSSAASWSPDGKWIAVSGADAKGPGLFKVPVEGGTPVRLKAGPTSNPVWSLDGSVIAYTDLIAAARIVHVHLIDPDGKAIATPELPVRVGGERYRFVPGRRQLVYMLDTDSTKQTFWIYDLSANTVRQLADFDMPGTRTFDIAPDGTRIVFDRVKENSDIVLIDLPDPAASSSR